MSARFGTPSVAPMAKSASASGGLTRRPRLDQIAVDRMMKLVDSVAMIGGIASARMRA